MLRTARGSSRVRQGGLFRLALCSARSSVRTAPSIVAAASSPSRSISHSAPRRAPLTAIPRAYTGPIPARTHSCGSLRVEDAGKQVTLAGWLLTGRQVSKKLAFYPLRDEHGITQLVVKASNAELMEQLAAVTLESVVLIEGVVRERGGARNESMLTGDIEVEVESFTLLNAADKDLPLRPSDEHSLANEALRARYRYLDLRRPTLTSNLRIRSRATHAARTHLHALDFLEVETPILLRSTPEGAREFLVPTRVPASSTTQAGGPSFYALQQSPQQPKQLLISSGAVQKYFQIARCFRDEDGRKDRQPEFTQVDIEMAFVSGAPVDVEGQGMGDSCGGKWRMGGGEVRDVVEGLVKSMWEAARGKEEADALPERFPVLTYREAMSRFGSDKPDLRMGLEIRTVSDALHPAEFEASDPQPDVVELLCYTPSSAEGKFSSKALDALLLSKDGQASKLECFKGSPHSPNELSALLLRKSKHVASYLQASDIDAVNVPTEALAEAVRQAIQAGSLEVGGRQVSETAESCYFFVGRRSNPPDGGSTALGELRLRLADDLRARGVLATPSTPALTWVTEFPLFTRVDADKAHLARGRTWSSTHHPFTAPMYEDLHLVDSAHGKATDEDLARVRGQHYDLVLDGQEVGGGSVRIHDARLQEKVMREVLELTDEEVGRFGHLLHALKCGAPPHGGVALGLDRLIAILCRTSTIRDVIAFPKSASGYDPVFGSPARLTEPVRDAEEKRALTAAESEEEEALLRLYGLAKAK